MYFATAKSRTEWWCLQFHWFRNCASCRLWVSVCSGRALTPWWTRPLSRPALLRSAWGSAPRHNTGQKSQLHACAVLPLQGCGICARFLFWCLPNAKPDGGAYFCFFQHRRFGRRCWFRKCLGVQTISPSRRVSAWHKRDLHKLCLNHVSW